jgi:hypothetical protein
MLVLSALLLCSALPIPTSACSLDRPLWCWLGNGTQSAAVHIHPLSPAVLVYYAPRASPVCLLACREQLGNPDMLRTMFDPANMQAMMQMQQAMQQLSGNPLLGGLFGAGAGAAGSGPGAAGGPGVAGLQEMLAGMGSLGGGFGAPAAVADPETAYASQLQQLQDMGFFDRQSNITALQATGGNVNAAVDRLLSQM